MRASRRVARLQERQAAVAETRAAISQRAVGYIRVSTEEQAEKGHGLEVQDKAIRAFAESQGYELVRVVADPAVSGATRPAERPGFGEVLGLAAAGEISILLVWKFDRLARQIVYSVVAANELAELGVAVRSVTEPIDTATPMGRTIFAVLAGMAEQERAAITERTWSGRREKATKGGFAGGATPYGYQRDLEGGLIVNGDEALVVMWIHALRHEGAGYAAIARQLTAAGFRPRRGAKWRHGGVAYILDNPKYGGLVEYLFRAFAGTSTLTHVLVAGAHVPIVEP